MRRNRIVSFAVIAALLLTAAACDKNKLREARKAADRVEILTTAGVDSIIAFEAQGVITKAQERELAMILLDVNAGNTELIRLVKDATVWNESTRTAVIRQLRLITDSVTRLSATGVLHIKNPQSKAKFDTLIQSIRSALAVLEGAVA